MATTNLYLDMRNVRADETYPLKLKVTLDGSRGFLLNLQTALTPDQWDRLRGRVVRHQYAPDLNRYLQGRQTDVEMVLRSMELSGELLSLTTSAIKTKIEQRLSGHGNERHLFVEHFAAFADRRNRDSTREIYRQTMRRVVSFGGENVAFEDITYSWLTDFEHYMQGQGLSQNTQDIQFRNIRAVYKDVVRRGIIPSSSAYPFNEFKHRQVTVPIDTLSVEQIKQFRDYPCEPHQKLYIDLFMLMFYLHGINIGDLLLLKPSDFRKGRIEFDRQKTGRHYSIKVEPEALEIIDKYRGEIYLLNVLERWSDHHDFNHKMNRILKQIGEVNVCKHGRKERTPFCPELTTYWARRSLATIAFTDADISVDVIGQMLGHQMKNQLTWRYIKISQKKIDDANRKILDLIKR